MFINETIGLSCVHFFKIFHTLTKKKYNPQHGRQLLENYRSLVEELTQEDLDHLAHARSCSVSN